MAGLLGDTFRSIRSMIPVGSKSESINFVRFTNEPDTELATMANGAKCGEGGLDDSMMRRKGSGASSRYSTIDGLNASSKLPGAGHPSSGDQGEQKPNRNAINEWQAGWNVTNAIQGMFIVTFPYAVLEGGYWALVSMVVVAYICCYTGKILVECLYGENEKGEIVRLRDSYVGIAEAVWGAQIGGRIVNLAQVIELLMTCILYVLLCGDLMVGVFPDSPFGLPSWIMICSVTLLPCAFLRSLRHVSFLSFWCTVAHMLINMIIICYCLTRVSTWHYDEVLVKIDMWTFPISLGIVIFSYTSQIFLPTLEGNMINKSKFHCMLYSTHVAAAIFKAGFSYIGFLTFGMATQEVITNNLPNQTMRVIVNLCLVVKALLSYPLPYFATAEQLEKTFFQGPPTTKLPPCYGGEGSGRLKVWALMLRLGLVVVTVIMAIFIPHFNILMGLIGSFTGNMLSLVWPCYFHLKLKGYRMPLHRRISNYLIIIVGLVCSVLGIYYSFHALVNAFYGVEPRPFQGHLLRKQ